LDRPWLLRAIRDHIASGVLFALGAAIFRKTGTAYTCEYAAEIAMYATLNLNPANVDMVDGPYVRFIGLATIRAVSITAPPSWGWTNDMLPYCAKLEYGYRLEWNRRIWGWGWPLRPGPTGALATWDTNAYDRCTWWWDEAYGSCRHRVWGPASTVSVSVYKPAPAPR
jgi:hypothetical protein